MNTDTLLSKLEHGTRSDYREYYRIKTAQKPDFAGKTAEKNSSLSEISNKSVKLQEFSEERINKKIVEYREFRGKTFNL